MPSLQNVLWMVVLTFALGCGSNLPKDLNLDTSGPSEADGDVDGGSDADGGSQDDTSSTADDTSSTADDTSSTADDSGTLPPDTGESPDPLVDGETCSADAECASTHCECVNFDCSERVCAPVDCLCGYGTSGSCDESMTGTPDPEDCDGEVECATMDECIPIGG
jgi:hypothetical protein